MYHCYVPGPLTGFKDFIAQWVALPTSNPTSEMLPYQVSARFDMDPKHSETKCCKSRVLSFFHLHGTSAQLST